ncbi:MAG: class I SAM-dependent methyltransferase [Myxococcaceae bacterium]|jgi:SAM-dependent methyltransferase|nr:class I SAM-dependent methyltransferase [Myxococcaceae bacterium]
MTFKDHFSGHAPAYAAFRPRYPPALVDALAEASPATDHVLEVGCGSGQLSVLLGTRFSHVTATDPSAEQLARAEPAERIEYRCAPAEQTGLPDSSVDCLVAAQAAHWFDHARFHAECRRVGRPGALVALVTYGLLFVRPDLDALLTRFALEDLADFWPPERRFVDDGYASLPFPFAPVSFPSVSMRAQWDLDGVLGYVRTWSAVQAAVREGRHELVDTFAETFSRAWGDRSMARELEWPLSIRAGRL